MVDGYVDMYQDDPRRPFVHQRSTTHLLDLALAVAPEQHLQLPGAGRLDVDVPGEEVGGELCVVRGLYRGGTLLHT